MIDKIVKKREAKKFIRKIFKGSKVKTETKINLQELIHWTLKHLKIIPSNYELCVEEIKTIIKKECSKSGYLSNEKSEIKLKRQYK